MKRAFTLIELLVVIAIIAILAAILFPVFAQAKLAAKKTASLSNFKQTGTSMAIYTTDSDDTFPLSFSYNSAGSTWRSGGYLVASPIGSSSSAGRDVEPRRSQEAAVSFNSMQPYMKSYDILKQPGLKDYATGLVQSTTGPKMIGVGMTYNGFLHSYSATAIASPSKLPLFWNGAGDENIVGNIAAPELSCPSKNMPCQFNPSSGPEGTPAAYGYNWFYWGSHPTVTSVYGKSSLYVASDSSAKSYNWGSLPKWPQYAALNVNTNPFSAEDPAYPSTDTPYWITDCVAPGATKGGTNTFYAGFFRPDSEYNYTTAQCDAGGG